MKTAIQFAVMGLLCCVKYSPLFAQQIPKSGALLNEPAAVAPLTALPVAPESVSTETPDTPTPHYYTVQLGTFPEARQADFESIRSYSYVYERDGMVYIGGFSSKEAAADVWQKVQHKGYAEALIVERPLKNVSEHYVVQVLTHTAGEPIDWKKLEPFGDLYSWAIDNGQVRIAIGRFIDINEARLLAQQVQTKGYKGAFVRKVTDALMNPVTVFDKEPSKRKDLAVVVEKKAQLKGIPKTTFSATRTHKTLLELQSWFKNLGITADTLDKAYAEAIFRHRRLKSYQVLAQSVEGFEGWESAKLLLCITRDLSNRAEAGEITDDLLNNLPDKSLESAVVVTAWAEGVNKKLLSFAKLSKRNQQIVEAYHLSFLKTKFQLEQYYQSKGLKLAAAQELSLSVLKTMLEADLDDF